MLIDLLLAVQLQTYPRAEFTKVVEAQKKELSAPKDAEVDIRKLADAGVYLNLIDNKTTEIKVGESKQEREEREEEERLRKEQENASKSVVVPYSGGYSEGYTVVGTYYGYCVSYVRSQGKSLPSGYGVAGALPAVKREPQVGDAMVTYEGWVGHVVLVTAVSGDYVRIREANYIYPLVTERTLNWRSGIVKGVL